MQQDGRPRSPSAEIGTSLVIALAVGLTVLLALFFSVADEFLIRVPTPVRPTAIAVAVVSTSTPLPSPSPSPSETPSATPTSTSSPTVPVLNDGSAAQEDAVTSTRLATATVETATPQPTDAPVSTGVPVLAEQDCGNVPPGWIAYTVRPGDSLFHLSANSGATINEIVQANCLDISVLYSGTQLYLPYTPPPRPPCGPPMWWERYLVQHGDTLFSLARARGTTVYAITQANCLVGNRILAGLYLYLPPLGASADPPPTMTSEPTSPPPPPTSPPQPPPSATQPPPTATSEPVDTPVPTPTSPPPPTDTPVPSPTPTIGAEPTWPPPTVAPTTEPAEPPPAPTEPSAPPSATPAETIPPPESEAEPG